MPWFKRLADKAYSHPFNVSLKQYVQIILARLGVLGVVIAAFAVLTLVVSLVGWLLIR